MNNLRVFNNADGTESHPHCLDNKRLRDLPPPRATVEGCQSFADVCMNATAFAQRCTILPRIEALGRFPVSLPVPVQERIAVPTTQLLKRSATGIVASRRLAALVASRCRPNGRCNCGARCHAGGTKGRFSHDQQVIETG